MRLFCKKQHQVYSLFLRRNGFVDKLPFMWCPGCQKMYKTKTILRWNI